ncbi:hypothetical protein [Cognatilysobacter lacus]|uniref:Uncharacterized protein n=1 Tax=Cognatilysobacter lacus TaxID=1643323 RepID=A0A5D8Z7M7_9GAMM|nr:hypothetical protein [Lysobacter lacus]TZF90801.1 hypothetical protein FW784_03890 [Lysobacter lacus]
MSTLDRITSAVEHPAPSREGVSPWTLLAAIALAPLAFTTQVSLSYGIASTSCTAGGAPHVALLAVNLMALAATVVGSVLAWRSWQRLRGEKAKDSPSQGEGRTRFIALCAVVGNAIIGSAVVFDLLASLLLAGCPGLPPVH